MTTGGYTEKADIYSLAMVWFELVTGEVPYAGMNFMQIGMQVGNGELRPQVRLPHAMPPAWAPVVWVLIKH